ncbi:MAG: MBL fold metallo-hydrolase [Candidatus Omnitrophica bacterium]|nr:MBL fold metallo-hydrolase [Candidatus Omnitrophota bacterium]MCB9748192.1 MBL fold metallo-hydrolase [Candidatus Omnitrophota bacterium]
MKSIKINFLGTNGWFSSQVGNTTCVLLEFDQCFVILDAGNGIKDLDLHIKDAAKPIFLFLSHYHIDHISGLHVLNKFKHFKELTICCQPGGKEILDKIICQPYTIAFNDLHYKVIFRELMEGDSQGFPFKVHCLSLVHSSPCFGFRFEVQDKIITYCTDTGICPNAVALAKNADLLITECAYLPGQVVKHWPHLNPEQAAQLAQDAGAKQLALIHFDAYNYPTMDKREEAGIKAKEIFRNTIVGKDGMQLEI